MIYTIYENQISLFIEDCPYNVPKEDPRFEVVKTLLEQKQFSKLKQILCFECYFETTEDLEYQSGALFYKGEQLPATLTDLILQSKIRGQSFDHYLKFFVALKYNQDFIVNPAKRKLFYKNFKDVYVLGDFVFYMAKDKLPIANFYDFFELPPYFQEEILKYNDVAEAIKSIAGFKSDKLVKVFKDEVLGETLDTYFIDFLALCKELIDPASVYSLWQNLKGNFDVNFPQSLNAFLKTYKNSEKGVCNFLINSEMEALRRLNVLVFENQELEVLVPDLGSAQAVLPVFQREVSRLRGNLFFLHLENHFPLLRNLEKNHPTFEIIVPQHNEELNEWSNLMKNCIAGYAQKAKRGECLLLGIKKNDKIIYNLEITRQGTIKQFLAKANTKVDLEDKKQVEDLLKKAYLIK